MAAVHPFRALRPVPALAAQIAAVPYDVVNTEEARALAAGNPLSFLRVSRAEIELPPGVDPYADAVYDRARRNFEALRRSSLVLEDEPRLYFYRLATRGAGVQTGLAACFSLDDYERDVIRKHERTRRDKEDDRTRHIITLGAQTGPVFLVYRASADVAAASARVTAGPPLIDFEAADLVRHTIWPVGGQDVPLLIEAFVRIPALYIADGHHRAASAARARAYQRDQRLPGTDLGDGAGAATMLAVAFPDDEVQVLAYNRVVKDLGGHEVPEFLSAVAEHFVIEPGGPLPRRRGEVSMFVAGGWRSLRPRVAPDRADAVASLDVSVLQDRLLEPVLGIADVRTDKRIDFVGGARGTDELERLVRSGQAAVAFSLHPVGVADLMAVSDRGAIMPPKSTWFEPKLRDGLLSHLI
jgi:uncharacterized protein (DUF1015 family)